MSWFRVDDKLHAHFKTMAAGVAAMGLWTLAGSWASDYKTDGYVPAVAIERMAGAIGNEWAAMLVTAGLWDEAEGGYRFHDWAQYNPSARASARAGGALSEKRSAAGKLGAAKRWNKPTVQATGSDGKVPSDLPSEVMAKDAPYPVPVPIPSLETPSADSDPKPQESGGEKPSHVPAEGQPAAFALEAPPSNEKAPSGDANGAGATSGGSDPAEPGKAASQKESKDEVPLPGTPARAVYEAILKDPELAPIVREPGKFAAKCTAPGCFPALDVVGEVVRAGGWLLNNPKNRKSDGNRFLWGWLGRAQERAPRVNAPAAFAPQRKPYFAPGQVGTHFEDTGALERFMEGRTGT